jgi:hypothetical protein
MFQDTTYTLSGFTVNVMVADRLFFNKANVESALASLYAEEAARLHLFLRCGGKLYATDIPGMAAMFTVIKEGDKEVPVIVIDTSNPKLRAGSVFHETVHWFQWRRGDFTVAFDSRGEISDMYWKGVEIDKSRLKKDADYYMDSEWEQEAYREEHAFLRKVKATRMPVGFHMAMARVNATIGMALSR